MTIGNFWHNWHRLACPDILLSSQFIARLIFYHSYLILYTIHPWSPVMLIVAEQSRREIAASSTNGQLWSLQYHRGILPINLILNCDCSLSLFPKLASFTWVCLVLYYILYD